MKEFRKVEFDTDSIELTDVRDALDRVSTTIPGNATLFFSSTFGSKPKFRVEAEWEVTKSETIVVP